MTTTSAAKRLTLLVASLVALALVAGCSGDPNASAKPVPETPNIKPKSKLNTNNLDLGIE